MPEIESSTAFSHPECSISTALEVSQLHSRCGVYTRPEIVRKILDAVGWRNRLNPSEVRLLEPAAGDGAFVVEAGRRLVLGCREQGVEPTTAALRNCIRSFELHPKEAARARSNVIDMLRGLKVHHRTAGALARAWIANADFLLTDPPANGFTHAVGNPPYVRWSKIPPILKAEYSRRLPAQMVGGDLFLPFLDRALDQLRVDGLLGFLCSDRWQFMAFAEKFRAKWVPRLTMESNEILRALDAFRGKVDAYPSIFVARKTPSRKSTLHALAPTSPKTLTEAGYIVKVGPALGHTAAFVQDDDEDDVEEELLAPWVDGSDILEGEVRWSGRRILVMHDGEGQLRDLSCFPRLLARLERHRKALESRVIVKSGGVWYRPIDKISRRPWQRPKLLIPELARRPRLALDLSGAIPSHGVYAVFAPDDDFRALLQLWSEGGLATALAEVAPKVKGGYIRCYKRFLDRLPAPPT